MKLLAKEVSGRDNSSLIHEEYQKDNDDDRTTTLKSIIRRVNHETQTRTETDQSGLEGATRIPRLTFQSTYDEGAWADTRGSLVVACAGL